jgi:hypothetical protein
LAVKYTLSELLLEEHSKRNSCRIADLIEGQTLALSELIDIFQGDELILAQRASAALNEYLSRHPLLIADQIPFLLNAMSKDIHPAIQRTVMRLFQFIDIPEDYEGIILEKAYELLLNPQKPVAIQVFSLQVIYNLCHRYPELKDELKTSLDLIENPSAGMRSRINRIRRSL